MSRIKKMPCGMYCDFGTKNASFLETHEELKALGVKNNYFMLEVKNPHLGVQDIDIHNPQIAPEDTLRIQKECAMNPWFFWREVMRVPAKGFPQPLSGCLTRASAAMCWCYTKSIDFMVCQPRQTYKTTWCTGISEYSFLHQYKNINIPFMHLKQDRVEGNLRTFRDYIYALPRWMNPFRRETKPGKEQKPPGLFSMTYKEHGTQLIPLSSAATETIAEDQLRGDTVFHGFIDEWEYIKYIDSVIAGAAPAMVQARNAAKEAGTIMCMMYASTPGNLETATGRAAKRIIDQTPRFHEKMYDLTDQELDEYFSGVTTLDAEGDTVDTRCVYIEFNWQQLRKSETWLKQQAAEAKRLGKVDEYIRGVLMKRTRGSASVLFRQEDVDYIVANVREPNHQIFVLNKYTMDVYSHKITNPDNTSDYPYFDQHIPYMIGLDTADGTGGDSSTFVGVHPYTLEIVFELGSPFMGPLDQIRCVAYLAKLLPNAVFCLESNRGKAIAEYVQESQLEHRFYHDPKLNISKSATMVDKRTPSAIEKASNDRRYIGIWVAEQNRKDMFDLLKRNVREYKHLINTKNVVDNIDNLIIDKTGKIRHDDKEHDDYVFAYMHVLYILQYGNSLHRFNIDVGKCTWEQTKTIIAEYEEEIERESVNNMDLGDLGEDSFEALLLKDMTSTDISFDSENGRDPYGYTRNDYQIGPQPAGQQESSGLSVSDLSLYSSLNTFY